MRMDGNYREGVRIAWVLTKFKVVTLQRIVKKERNGLNSNWVILHSTPNDELQLDQICVHFEDLNAYFSKV